MMDNHGTAVVCIPIAQQGTYGIIPLCNTGGWVPGFYNLIKNPATEFLYWLFRIAKFEG